MWLYPCNAVFSANSLKHRTNQESPTFLEFFGTFGDLDGGFTCNFRNFNALLCTRSEIVEIGTTLTIFEWWLWLKFSSKNLWFRMGTTDVQTEGMWTSLWREIALFMTQKIIHAETKLSMIFVSDTLTTQHVKWVIRSSDYHSNNWLRTYKISLRFTDDTTFVERYHYWS